MKTELCKNDFVRDLITQSKLFLKYLSLFILFALFAQPVLLNAQGNSWGLILTIPNNPSAYPNGSSYNSHSPTQNSSLNSIFSAHQVVEYKLSFPGARTLSIQNVHEIHLNGDVNSLANALDATGLFDEIEINPYLTTLSSFDMGCENPLEINDPDNACGNDDSLCELESIDAFCAWTISTGNPNIEVAVIDTEFDETHPDLVGKISQEVGDDTGNCNHGTQVSGMVAANPDNGVFKAGIGYNTSIAGYVVNTTQLPSGGCAGWPYPNAWQAFLDGHRIINLSWGGSPGSNFVADMLREMTAAGTFVALGAGPPLAPGSQHTDHMLYGAIPGVMIVTNVQCNDHHPMVSPHNTWIDVSAPGFQICRIQRDAPQVGYGGGTSLAAPIVCGIAALLLDVNPCLSGIQMEEIIKATANQIPTADEPNDPFFGLVGTGRVNAYEALLLAAEELPGETISFDQEWNTFRSIGGDVIIEDGATLTINATMKFINPLAGIIVKSGGKLVVNDATLTVGCNNQTWRGIEVLGNPNLSQFPATNQGFVELNNATIEFAEVGVSLINRHNYDSGGGILKADGADFLNCQQGVIIAKYENFFPVNPPIPIFNLSYVRNSTFTIDENYPFNYLGRHALVDRVSGISFNSCTFQDLRTNVDQEEMLFRGIDGWDSRYTVSNSSFSGLRYGVNAQNISTTKTFTVRNSSFDDNHVGITVRAVNNFTVAGGCEFTIGGFTGTINSLDHPQRQVGIFIDRSSGFAIEENSFKGDENAVLGAETIGICARDLNVTPGPGGTGTPNLDFNEIFKNSFTNLLVANLANGNNRGTTTEGGLTYLCNENISGNGKDFLIFEGEIADNQVDGNFTAAGNTFSHDGGDAALSDIDNTEGNSINYYYDPNDNAQIPIFVELDNLTLIQALSNPCNNDIIDDDIPHDDIPHVINDCEGKKIGYRNLKEEYSSLLDGGNTEATLELIYSTTPFSASFVRAQLLEYSPYLSEVVTEAIIENGVLNSNYKTDILSANPEVIKRPEIEERINNSGYFNSTQLAMLEQAREQTTSRRGLEHSIAIAFGEMQWCSNRLIRHYQSDPDLIDFDEIRYWSGVKSSLEGLYGQVESWFDEGNFQEALNLITAIPQMYSLGEEQVTEHHAYESLKNLQAGLMSSSRGYFDLSNEEKGRLEEVALGGRGLAKVQAENWLNLVYEGTYQKEPQLPAMMHLIVPETPDVVMDQVKAERLVEAFPNPARTYTNFHFNLTASINSIHLMIVDIDGRKVLDQKLSPNQNYFKWNTASVPSGLYFYRLITDKGESETYKIAIIK